MHVRSYPQDALTPGRPTGLILCGMGGPDGPQAVAPFLRNLFADPAIFPVPGLMGRWLGRWLATVRAPKVRRRYLKIDPAGATPQLPATRAQAATLAAYLAERELPTTPGVAMRYWHPFPSTTVAELLSAGAEQFIIVPMYPQFSSATSASTLDFVLEAVTQQAPDAVVHVLPQWPDLAGFIAALADAAVSRLAGWAESDPTPTATRVLLVAHSLPERLIRAGDPYLQQAQQTADLTLQVLSSRLSERGLAAWTACLDEAEHPLLAFQSRVGPIRWQGPDVVSAVTDLARSGCCRLLVVPISFTCEHIETVLELDVELRDHALDLGIAEFARVPVPAVDGPWLGSLGDLLLQRVLAPEVDVRG